MCCNEDLIIILEVIKVFYNFLKFALPIYLIIVVTIDVFRIIISKSEDDTKKIKKMIFSRAINCIIIFLIPTLVFFTFNALFGDNIIDITTLRSCWNL